MASLSLIISSGGRETKLITCLTSIARQSIPSEEVQLVIALPELELDRVRWQVKPLTDAFPILKRIEWIGISEPKAHLARNAGISHSRGSILQFMDEDVFLPDTDFLSRVLQKHFEFPHLTLIGGSYLSASQSSVPEKAYNHIAHLWLERTRISSEKSLLQNRILAGNFSLKPKHLDFPIFFSQERSFGGEEQDFLKKYWNRGLQSHWFEDLSVFHCSGHSMKTFFARAWLHGKYLDHDGSTAERDWKILWRHSSPTPESGLGLLYLLCTRSSQWIHLGKKHFKKFEGKKKFEVRL